jgi:cell division protein FtsB
MNVLQPKIIIGTTLIAALLLFLSLGQEMSRRWQVQREVRELEGDVAEMHKNVLALQNLNQYFRTDDFQERLAREKLNYSAPGETVVLIPEEAVPPTTTTQEVTTAETAVRTIPERWWRLFFVDETS